MMPSSNQISGRQAGGNIMERRLRARMFGVCGAAALALSAGSALVASGVAVADPPEKLDVTICHATAAEQNPYVTEEPANQGVLEGHFDHTGPIFNAADPEPGWGDI